MALTDGLMMTSKFRGCLLASLLGDCLGSPYEGDLRPSPVVLRKYFDTLEGSNHKAPLLQYTDDTAMTNCVAESLIAKENLDVSDLAKRFVKEYFNQPRRGYGMNVIDVFAKLRMTKCKDPLGPAREQFGGTGSYGNGGAMRIAPIALFFRGTGTQSLGTMAQKATEITHTHANGINGAILQCLAIEQALWLNPKQPLDTAAFLEELIAKMQLYEKGDNEFVGRDEDQQPFINRLRWALELLQREKSGSKKIKEEEDVLNRLGSGVSAITSVPTAIFCFLRAQQGHIPLIETDNPLRRTLQYAISLGGDTDTVATMAGAMAGAFLGDGPEYFNENVTKRCEGVENTLDLTDRLYSKCCGQ
ncbi:ADP-ribosylhydrolase ARH3-like [Hetaerina americana]|uniref:ADP-ribosylhydrolase ARH3-like n=1 Tax=Hetaerina americana TaxID=62018 RepID=UPI003A7F4804